MIISFDEQGRIIISSADDLRRMAILFRGRNYHRGVINVATTDFRNSPSNKNRCLVRNWGGTWASHRDAFVLAGLFFSFSFFLLRVRRDFDGEFAPARSTTRRAIRCVSFDSRSSSRRWVTAHKILSSVVRHEQTAPPDAIASLGFTQIRETIKRERSSRQLPNTLSPFYVNSSAPLLFYLALDWPIPEMFARVVIGYTFANDGIPDDRDANVDSVPKLPSLSSSTNFFHRGHNLNVSLKNIQLYYWTISEPPM